MRAEPAREGPRGLSLADTRTFACSRGFVVWPAGGTGFRKQARQQDVICFSSAEEALPAPFPEGKCSENDSAWEWLALQ